jgi:hypothetical protein
MGTTEMGLLKKVQLLAIDMNGYLWIVSSIHTTVASSDI